MTERIKAILDSVTAPTISQDAREAGEMVERLRRDAEKLGGPLTETEMKGWVTPQRLLDAICAERFIAAADLISRLSTDTEAMRLLREARVVIYGWIELGRLKGNPTHNAADLLARIDALAKGRG